MNMDQRRRASSRYSSCSRPSFDSDEKCIRRLTITSLLMNPDRVSRETSVSYDKLQSQWEILMRKFSKDYKRLDHGCNVVPPEDMTCELRELKEFNTGSKYEGTWDALGICGYGTYTFPNGAVYDGQFEDSMFHGEGELKYPDGITLRGKWDHGDLIDRTIVFPDGVHYKEENWKYCVPPDRRFAIEYSEGVKGARETFLTNDQPTKDVPQGCYDVGDGFYDPNTGTVYKYDDLSAVVRMVMDRGTVTSSQLIIATPTKLPRCPDKDLQQWITETCRTSPENVSSGPEPDMYKPWLEANINPTSMPKPPCAPDDEDISDTCSSGTTFSTPCKNEESISSRRTKFGFNQSTDRAKLSFDAFRPDHYQHSQLSMTMGLGASRLKHGPLNQGKIKTIDSIEEGNEQ